MQKQHLAAILLPALLAIPRPAAARPMATELKEVTARATSIVVAEFVGPVGTQDLWQASEFILNVKKTVRGTDRSGYVTVKLGTGHPDVAAGAEVIAFIDRNDCFSFVAEPLPGQPITTGALMVRGFYDFNAHLVSPSLITLPKLLTFADTGDLDYQITGPLQVLAADGSAIVASKINLDIDYDWKGSKTSVKGFAAARGFPKPQVYITPGWDPHITLTYRSSWPRPLVISGDVTGVDKQGTFLASFRVSEPDLLTENQLERYLKNQRHAYAVWHYQITLDNRRKWRLSDGHDYGGNVKIVTDNGDDYRYSSFSFTKDAGQRRIELQGKGGALVVELGPRIAGPFLDERGTLRTFHQELLHGPLGCKITSGDGSGHNCTIELTKVSFAAAIKAP